MKLDSVYINVHNIEEALQRVKSQLGLKPFLRFELVEPAGVTPIALIQLGEHTLELLGSARGERPTGTIIQRVEIALPIASPLQCELMPDSELIAYPSTQAGIRSVEVLTPRLQEDSQVLTELFGAKKSSTPSSFDLSGVQIILTPRESTVSKELPSTAFPGWHRLSFQVSSVRQAYTHLIANGLCSLGGPMSVLPGFNEAMIVTVSGLILQVTEQHLWKMLPILAVHSIKSALTKRPIQFRVSDLVASRTASHA